jgi:UDPglucose--hexose-1-phosphate uridylyltransferase
VRMNRKFNAIEFKREIRLSRMLKRDESGELAEATVPLEFRFDPLTGHSCRIVQFTLERIIRPDLDELEKRSRELTCPFCPPLLEQITPRFPPDFFPEGNIRIGKSYTFPNSGPYDVYGAVVVMSDEHFIRLDGFTPEIISDALLAAQTHIRRAEKVDSAVKYHFIAWNYMPPSGGSLVHPHLQSNAGYIPTTYQKLILEASAKYREENGTNYWSDLLEQEKRAGERYIGKTGNVEWLTPFMPRGRLSEVIALFPGRASITELTEKDLRDFSTGLVKVFGYLDSLNLPAFNMSTYSGHDSNRFWTHARITPRGSLLYSPIETSDQFYYQIMHDENVCILPPEVACEKLKELFIG